MKIELESLFSINYLIQKWSQVQNDHKNAMIIDISELTITDTNEIPVSSE